MRFGIVVPFFDHGEALGATLEGLRAHGLPCWVVDDGSHLWHAEKLRALGGEHRDWVRVVTLPSNQGKGAAVIAGFAAAAAAGCTHAVQIDADGQHDPAELPRFLAAARAQPQAVIAGVPVYDDSVPRLRLYGRYLTHLLVWLNTGSLAIRDSMCGFRLYPLAPTLRLWAEEPVGRRMQFDTEILVRLFWRGVPVVNLPTPVTYPRDGVSHFDLLRDNLRLAAMHGRLFAGMLRRAQRLWVRRREMRCSAAPR